MNRLRLDRTVTILLLAAVGVSPLAAVVGLHSLALAGLLAFCFWPSLIAVANQVYRQRCWPQLGGGPSWLTAYKHQRNFGG